MNDTNVLNLIQSEREYVDFFNENDEYKERILLMINAGVNRLIVNINDLRRENPARAAKVIDDSTTEMAGIQKALKRVVQNVNPDFAKKFDEFFVGFEGSFGSKHVTPRALHSSLLGKMICLEGIVTKSSIVHPKLIRSVHYCPVTKKTIEKSYGDMTNLDALGSGGVYPTKDDEGNILETEYGLCTYKDNQTGTIQEMPESAPAGQLPRSIDVLFDNDLVDKCKPGDRVQIVGQFRCLPGKKNGYTSASFKSIIMANNVKLLTKDSAPVFSEKDISLIRVISKRPDIVKALSKSIAPTIHGHDKVKQALLYQLVGGVERNLINGSRIRGDINLLLMGDPSVAKSQFLRFVLQIAKRAVTTTGRGSSGVGLTAAVTTDPETGERCLEAGAMVLADRGIVCIDEFDKMSDIDRTAIHEVMEQGRVTISKAGIHSQLNARCSVLAAANPVYGRYNLYKTPMENIGLQDSLLSRFDLLFVLLDTAEQTNDMAIAEHVLRTHRFRTPGEAEGEALPMQSNLRLLTTANMNGQQAEFYDATSGGYEHEEEEQVYEQAGSALLGQPTRKTTGRRGNNAKDEIFTLKFLQKYLHVARDMKPRLKPDAASILASNYCELRQMETSESHPNVMMRRTQPITARTLETLIRLATANAKLRISKEVEKVDAEAAVELLSSVMFKEQLTNKSRKRRVNDGSDAEEEEEEQDKENNVDIDSADEFQATTSHRRLPNQQTNLNEDENSRDPFQFRADESSNATGLESRSKRLKKLDSTKLLNITKTLSKVFQETGSQELPIERIVSILREADASLSKNEIMEGLKQMSNENKIMLTHDHVYPI